MSSDQPAQQSGASGDKRKIRRASRRLMVRYGVDGPNKTGFTRNISDTGLFIQTNMVVTPGSTLQVQFELLNRQFTIWAKVMWARKVPAQLAQVMQAGMGVKFIDPPEAYTDTYRAWAKSGGIA